MEAVTADIPREVQDLLVDIEYISAIPPGHKFDIESRRYIGATGFIAKSQRTVYSFWLNEDRVGTLNFINGRITTAIGICKRHVGWRDLITDKITSISDTITNLMHVYHDDPNFAGKLKTVMLRVNPEGFRKAYLEVRVAQPKSSEEGQQPKQD